MLEMKGALTTINHPKKAALLTAYAACGTVTKAAEVANTARGNHRLWRAKDPAYAEAFEEAKEAFKEKLEEEAYRRAIDGCQEPIVFDGRVIGHRLKYSDTLMIFMLKALDPDKYRENRGIINALQVAQNPDPSGEITAKLDRIAERLRAAGHGERSPLEIIATVKGGREALVEALRTDEKATES